MDFFTALDVSSSGLAAERERVNVASSNLANAESTRSADGSGLYRRRDPVVESVPFEAALEGAVGVQVSEVVEDSQPGRKVYSPNHPDADPQGFVSFPNVNPVHEVVNLLSASKSYEANASAVDTLKGMAQRALDIAK
ncbi:MAG TPA: flagellar basal body rod protein FlgC [Myxococcales bacterium]|jgi:flagellar basal-body rod protein FlgC|nr:flagellar basal body rod protein FlgC [Myxococcales bacterium]